MQPNYYTEYLRSVEEHQARLQQAENERLAAQQRTARPNAMLTNMGRLLVAAGEQLQTLAQPEPNTREQHA